MIIDAVSLVNEEIIAIHRTPKMIDLHFRRAIFFSFNIPLVLKACILINRNQYAGDGDGEKGNTSCKKCFEKSERRKIKDGKEKENCPCDSISRTCDWTDKITCSNPFGACACDHTC